MTPAILFSHLLLLQDDLVVADDAVVVKLRRPIIWLNLFGGERLPLGMNLLLNDDSGFEGCRLPRGSQVHWLKRHRSRRFKARLCGEQL
jgi:hypothetical protein